MFSFYLYEDLGEVKLICTGKNQKGYCRGPGINSKGTCINYGSPEKQNKIVRKREKGKDLL